MGVKGDVNTIDLMQRDTKQFLTLIIIPLQCGLTRKSLSGRLDSLYDKLDHDSNK
jgi:hypothetical protein